MIAEIKNDINGLAALADWLGDHGSPVHPMIAEYRASTCLTGNEGKPCPLNKSPKWWETAKGVIADWVRAELRIKSGMQLTVQGEDHLGICAACGCALPLVVWCPTEHFKTHTTEAAMKQFPSYCWKRKELTHDE